MTIRTKQSESDLKDLVKACDGSPIDFDLFCSLMQRQSKSLIPEEEIIEAFKVFDKENNGLISAAEMRHIMTNIGNVIGASTS